MLDRGSYWQCAFVIGKGSLAVVRERGLEALRTRVAGALAFHTVADFQARKVRFQLRRCESQGIMVSTDPNNFSRLSSTGTADVCGR